MSITESLGNCLAVQEEAIRRFKPDVVIGSSWGGGIGLLALATGAWQGPTILLAPALKTVTRKTALPVLPEFQWDNVCAALQSSAALGNLIVVHGDADETIPLQDSLDLAEATGAELRVIPGGDHRLNAAMLHTDEIVRLVDEVVGRANRGSMAGTNSD